MKKIIGLSVLVLTIGLFACNKSDDVSIQSEELSEKSAQVAANEVSMEAVTVESEYEVEFFSNLSPILSNWWKYGKHFSWTSRLRYKMNQCPDVQITEGDDDGYPKIITMNYGDSTVLNNGTVLSGVIEITITAPRSSQDYERTVEYQSFGVDSVVVDGYATILVDKVDSMFRQYTSSLTFTLADGSTIERTSERTWQWIEGMDTPEDQSDDVVVISGGAEAVMTIDGVTETYKKEITTPLKRLGDCRYIVEGVVEISLDGTVISTIDYGDGTCDEVAVVTDADGNQTEIDLHDRKYKEETNKHQSGKKGK